MCVIAIPLPFPFYSFLWDGTNEPDLYRSGINVTQFISTRNAIHTGSLRQCGMPTVAGAAKRHARDARKFLSGGVGKPTTEPPSTTDCQIT